MAVTMRVKGTTRNQFRIAPDESAVGAPTTGAHEKGEEHVDSEGSRFYCIADGTPGTWIAGSQGGAAPGVPGSSIKLIFPITFNKTTGGTQNVKLNKLAGWRMDTNRDNRGAEFLFVLTDEVNLSTDPKVRADFYTLTTGGGAGVTLRCTARFLADGELLTKAPDQIVDVVTNPVVNTVGARHKVLFTLDKTLIATTDAIFIVIERLGSDAGDTFAGRIMFASSGGLEFGA